jgi:hypothetical protein
MLAVSALLYAPPAHADSTSVAASVGYDYSVAPDRQWTRAMTSEVEATHRTTSASLSLGRVDDSGTGVGLDVGAGLGLPLARRTKLQLGAERAGGDSSYRAWRLKAGPAIDLQRGRTLTLTLVREQDSEHTITNGASAALEAPLVPDRLSASGTIAYTRVESLGGIDGAAGLSWSPLDHVEIEGDAGYTQTGVSLNRVFSSKHAVRAGRGKAPGKPGTTTSTDLQGSPGITAELAVRFSFP